MSLDLSDSDIEPFIPDQDENELHPQAEFEGSSTGSDSDETSSPPSTSPAVVMSASRFFSKRPLDISKSSRDSSSKKRRSQETVKPQKRHALVHVSSRNKRGTGTDSYVGSCSTPRRPISGGAGPPHFSSTDDESCAAATPSVAPTCTPTNASSVDSDPSVKLALKEITSLLNTVVKRVERVESELKKSTATTSSSESSPSHSSKKQYVPTVVRVSSVHSLCMILNLCLQSMHMTFA